MLKKPTWTQWNHNAHYHERLISILPTCAQNALDGGCGAGDFTERLAKHVPHVVGIDVDQTMVELARSRASANVEYVLGDLMTAPLNNERFDAVTGIAVLHHLPLEEGLARFGALVAPGGTLAILGLYRNRSVLDRLLWLASVPVDLAVGIVRSRRRSNAQLAPVAPWSHSLTEIRVAAFNALPGAKVKRLLYSRYLLVWRKPAQIP